MRASHLGLELHIARVAGLDVFNHALISELEDELSEHDPASVLKRRASERSARAKEERKSETDHVGHADLVLAILRPVHQDDAVFSVHDGHRRVSEELGLKKTRRGERMRVSSRRVLRTVPCERHYDSPWVSALRK